MVAAPALNIRLPVKVLAVARVKAPEVPLPTVTVWALILSPAVKVAPLEIVRARMPLVEPILLLILLEAVIFTVPRLLPEPSISPDIEPLPMLNTEPLLRVKPEVVATEYEPLPKVLLLLIAREVMAVVAPILPDRVVLAEIMA